MSVVLPQHLKWPAVRIAIGQQDVERHRSRIGGAPELPPGLPWPEGRGRPLDFLVQLNLAELNVFETGLNLPRDGRLLFFYDTVEQPWGFDPGDRDSSCVVFIADNQHLMARYPPNSRPSLPQYSVSFEPIVTVPDLWSPLLDRVMDNDERIEWAEELGDPIIAGQIGGHPVVIQNSMERQCALVSSGLPWDEATATDKRSAEADASEWRLLLQLPSLNGDDLMWGDSGMIYYWINRTALSNRDFSQTWLVLQCF